MKNRIVWVILACAFLFPVWRDTSPAYAGFPKNQRGLGGKGMGGKALNPNDVRRARQIEILKGRSDGDGPQRGGFGGPQGSNQSNPPAMTAEEIKRAERKAKAERRKARLREQVAKKKAEALQKAQARKAQREAAANGEPQDDAERQSDDAPRE
jgi:hypothetical protein